ncbi:class I SAM-dependent methyltransferase [Alkalihalophilus lindianensis]|uniref:Class I SAM-dependent methyltransferase n=1 Tax=Alkalihalophilus lindianensis TaxID=1630542 RepID=A0ABU3X9S1_9BACI|nr:class I SAM-dependent methyltransferase [Alkalihalophilus lindianensis]MDV2684639.1 class I SAM-dependent methyltransferase [Alkalihalophilus lindianensis]
MKLDNFDKYKDPLLYDVENDHFEDDLALIEEYAARTSGPIIDLACGTGRTALHLARLGHDVVGIDIHQGMLEHAKNKTQQANLKIDFQLQDATTLSLSLKGSFLFLVGNAFQHFLTNEDQDKLLEGIYTHIEEDGIFLFGTRFLEKEDIIGTAPYNRTFRDHLGREITEWHIETYDPLEQILTCNSKVQMIDGVQVNGEEETIRLRYVFPKEMERLLTSKGFSIIHAYADWKKTPLHARSRQMIYVCKKIKNHSK